MFARKLAAVLGVALLAACSGRDTQPVDASLSGDLALAASSQPYQQQQYMSPAEQQGYAPQYAQASATRGGYSQPAAARTRTRTTTRPQSTSTGSSGDGEVVRNTRRDAVIGATAGAVIGATTSRDKVKGAVIGAAAGAVLGGIVGHTVDVDHRY